MKCILISRVISRLAFTNHKFGKQIFRPGLNIADHTYCLIILCKINNNLNYLVKDENYLVEKQILIIILCLETSVYFFSISNFQNTLLLFLLVCYNNHMIEIIIIYLMSYVGS